MKQFILAEDPDNNIVRLKGSDYRYLVRVRRLAAGEYFTAILPDGNETQVQVLSIENGILTGRCEVSDIKTSSISELNETDEAQKSASNIPPIILFQALPKSDKMDTIVRQAAETGITEIVPFVSEFSAYNAKNSTLKSSFAEGQKFKRWQRIIKEARQQSGSKIATAVREPLSMSGLFEYWAELNKTRDTLGLLFHHIDNRGLEKKSLHCYLSSIRGGFSPAVVLAIGPEGGFSDTEVSLFLENDFKPLTIGDTVLRTDTAAVFFSAAIRVLLLERKSWEMKQT